jgi:hypothetical protein
MVLQNYFRTSNLSGSENPTGVNDHMFSRPTVPHLIIEPVREPFHFLFAKLLRLILSPVQRINNPFRHSQRSCGHYCVTSMNGLLTAPDLMFSRG